MPAIRCLKLSIDEHPGWGQGERKTPSRGGSVEIARAPEKRTICVHRDRRRGGSNSQIMPRLDHGLFVA